MSHTPSDPPRGAPGLTYRDAGVDIDAKMDAIARIRDKVQSTYSDAVLADIGSFGGMGTVERDQILDGSRVEVGQELLGIPSFLIGEVMSGEREVIYR